jgi:hypothetical protein
MDEIKKKDFSILKCFLKLENELLYTEERMNHYLKEKGF